MGKEYYNYYLLFFSGVTRVRTMQFLVVSDKSEVRPKLVLAARWRRRANPKSPIDSTSTVSYWCFCDIYRLSLTVNVFRLFLSLQIETGSSYGR
jgi:hypothetical protein